MHGVPRENNKTACKENYYPVEIKNTTFQADSYQNCGVNLLQTEMFLAMFLAMPSTGDKLTEDASFFRRT